MSIIVWNGCLALFAELRHGASAPPNFIALPMTHSADGKQMGILVVNSAGAVDNSILTLWPQAAMYHGVPNWEARVVYPSMANTPCVDATIRTITQAATVGSSPSHTIGNSVSPSRPPAAASPKFTYSPKTSAVAKGGKTPIKAAPPGARSTPHSSASNSPSGGRTLGTPTKRGSNASNSPSPSRGHPPIVTYFRTAAPASSATVSGPAPPPPPLTASVASWAAPRASLLPSPKPKCSSTYVQPSRSLPPAPLEPAATNSLLLTPSLGHKKDPALAASSLLPPPMTGKSDKKAFSKLPVPIIDTSSSDEDVVPRNVRKARKLFHQQPVAHEATACDSDDSQDLLYGSALEEASAKYSRLMRGGK